jgi:hypothetical protein
MIPSERLSRIRSRLSLSETKVSRVLFSIAHSEREKEEIKIVDFSEQI